jgi:hypothetical protein
MILAPANRQHATIIEPPCTDTSPRSLLRGPPSASLRIDAEEAAWRVDLWTEHPTHRPTRTQGMGHQ